MGKQGRKARSYFSVVLVVILLITTIFPGPLATLHAAEIDKEEAELPVQTKQQTDNGNTILEVEHEHPSQLTESQNFTVEVSNEKAVAMTLHYKSEETKKDLQMERLDESSFTATIPGSDVTPKTIEYWFEAEMANEGNKTSLTYLAEVVKDTTDENTKGKTNQSLQKESTDRNKQPSEKTSKDTSTSANDTGTLADKTTETTESDTAEKTQTGAASQNKKQKEEAFTIDHNPITEINGEDDLTIEATVPNAANVTLTYHTGEQMQVDELAFSKVDGTDTYNVQIPSDNFWSPVFRYQITAEDKDGNAEKTNYIEAAVTFSETPDPKNMPTFLITEITPDTANIGGSDGYEFIEIYNNTDQSINMKDYKLKYGYPDGSETEWNLTKDKEIGSQETLVVWIHNGTNDHLNLDDFNENYGTKLTEDQVTIIEYNGMANGSERTLSITDNYGNDISKATYNETETDDTQPNQGITYQYPMEGTRMTKVGISEEANPAAILSGQVPNDPVAIDGSLESPVIGEPVIDVTNDAITAEVDVTSETDISGVNLFYKQSDAMGFESVSLNRTDDPSIYTISLPLNAIWSDKIRYYFTAANQAGESDTETKDIAIPQAEYDAQTVPRLLITEITPDTMNMNGSDAYEFIEIYNNSNQPINLQDYKLIYRYPTSTPDQDWDLTEDKVIGPQESFIVWIHNQGNQEATLEDFNAAYGLSLPESHVTIIENNGMANGSERTLLLTDDFGNVITEATYNNDADDVYSGQGITYKYPTEGHVMENVGTAASISPLTVFPEQIPQEPVKIDTDTEAPKIGDPSLEMTDEAIRVQIDITSEQQLNGVNLHFRQSESLEFETIHLASENDKTYTAKISMDDIWSDHIDYYFAASNQAGKTKTVTRTFELPQSDVDYQTIPPLLITEVVPDSSNANGADAYEFIEIYNNTTEDIDLDDYIIRYRYPNTGAENDLLWGLSMDQENVIIPSGESIVLWVINSGNPNMNGEDFNTHYGTNLTEGTDLIKIYNNGMSNSSERTLTVATKTGHELSYVNYNDVNGVDDTVANKGILYRFPHDGGTTSTKISSGEFDATPGTIMPEQVPEKKTELPADSTDPVVEDATNKEDLTSEESFKVSATITDDHQVKSVYLYYRTVEGNEFSKVSLERGDNDTYQHTIYEPELIGQENLAYYFVASDGKNQHTTEKETLSIAHPNAETGLRLNVDENELLSGEKLIKATEDAYTENIDLFLDDEQVTDTYMAMENEAYFAFDVSETNIFFQNGVTMGDEVLEIFDDTYTDFVTLTVPISPEKLEPGENTITIRSGNKVSPFDETSTENRDDFTIKNVRLVLLDGTIIYDPDYSDPNTNYAVGDSTGKQSVYDFTFTLEQEKFASAAYLFDTTAVEDGDHEIRAVLDDEDVTTTVITDNTAPVITPSVKGGKEYKGDLTIDADVQDANEVQDASAELDGNPISLPYETSSALLAPGEHEAVFTAEDAAGNVRKTDVTFSVVEEHPGLPDWQENKPDSTSADLSVRLNDPTEDAMDVGFYQGYQYTAEDTENLRISQNMTKTEPPQTKDPEDATMLTEYERSQLLQEDGEKFATESNTAFPYHRFDVTVDENVDPEDEIEVVWDGSSIEGRKVTMYAWNYTSGEWVELTSTIAGAEEFQLIGSVTGADYLQDGKVSVIVQDQVASSGEDFSLVWMTDTQYYSESYPYIYEDQVNWIVEHQNELNIEYVFHTGDLVNVYDDFDQWAVANQNMKVLDDTGIPYGVLAGNHDVDMKNNNYVNYNEYFGADRFEDRAYYGDSYENNRGHYDLLSVNGNDFIMLYMGWGVDQAGMDWMNDVLAAHPNRTAILSFHEYLLASGTRSPIGDDIFEQVVVPNDNVKAVLSGHYHNAQTLIDEIDDDGDGAADRSVYQMLADYQGGPEGGQGYLRILNFNMDSNTVDVQTYSPYLDEYNFYDPEDFPGKDEFAVDWNLEAEKKRVATDYVEVNVYTDEQIGLAEKVPSGEDATVTWDGLEPESEYFWYTIATDAYGGNTRSNIWGFTTVEGEVVPEEPEKPEVPEDPGDPNDKPEDPGEPDDQPGEPERPDDQTGKPLPNNQKQTVEADVSDGRAVIQDNVFEAVDQSGNIIIKLNAETAVLDLTKEQVAALKDKQIILTITNSDITLDIPASVFSGTGVASIDFEKLDDVKDALSPVYDFSITQGDTVIHEFAEGITLTFHVDEERVQDPLSVKLYHLNEETDEWDVIGGEYANGKVTAPLTHFSTFAVFEKEKATDDQETSVPEKPTADSGSGKGLPDTATNMFNYLFTGVILSTIGGGMLAMWYVRRKRFVKIE
ncbi:Lamin Tail Domain [Lentibacillus halodurans]|uniref:Lamin Tail Domain n=1 Tax=Lentibacillus halodurans TaxID=237679 RepID=A0A1I0W496_9BACI|nr:lamin tail domain-containing protein [Lentibacillus halodurans]SFA83565.1 Lamin Tail Domain [Lentibacillus halodurans]